MAEMSGRFPPGSDTYAPRFTASGHELSAEEYYDGLVRTRQHRVERRINQRMSFLWFGHALGLPKSFDLGSMLRQVGFEGSAAFYNEPRLMDKPEGGTRTILVPKPELMFVQRRINRLLLRTFKRHPNTFGYTGGNRYEVATRHAAYRSTFKFDIRDAFSQIGFDDVKQSLIGDRYFNRAGFSATIAHWIAQLCVFDRREITVGELREKPHSFLPQGAPSSPICFHVACGALDAKLTRVAERVGGIVSRFADNYYFSTNTSRFPRKLEGMLVCDTINKGFPVHKVRRVHEGELCRILGYNVLNGRITNTRDFHRRLRGALYVLRTRIDRGLEWEEAYVRVRGFMGVAVNLPDNLQQTYEYCESRIASL